LHDAALYIQNLIRGAETQVRLNAGKEKRLGLVRELRLAHELVAARQAPEALSRAAEERYASIRSALLTSATSTNVSQVICEAVDALAKERVRREQVLRASAILEIAARERARREHEESVTREREAYERSRRDFIYQSISRAHRGYADMLVDRMAQRAVLHDADERSKELAVRQVEALVALDAQTSQEAVRNPQEAIGEILHGFLLPEVDRRILVERMRSEEAKYGLAARAACEEVQSSIENMQKQE